MRLASSVVRALAGSIAVAGLALTSAAYAQPAGHGADAGTYRVQRGDSLDRIARRLAGAHPERTAALAEAIYHGNPKAFIGGERNRLRRDAELALPGPVQAPPVAASAAGDDDELSFAESIARTAGEMSAQLSPDAGLIEPAPASVVSGQAAASAPVASIAAALGASTVPYAASIAPSSAPAAHARHRLQPRRSLIWLGVLILCVLVAILVWRRKDAAPRRAARVDTPPPNPTGREAGKREIDWLAQAREGEARDREEQALLAQLARAPRDVGALYGLAQINARRGDRAALRQYANLLFEETDGEGLMWRRTAELGRALDPDEPLYGDDPYRTLAEHAGRQASGPRSLPLRESDLELGAPAASEARSAEDEAAASAAPATQGQALSSAPGTAAAAPQAPAEWGQPADPFQGIDLDLGAAPSSEGTAPKPPTGAAGNKRRGARSARGKGGRR